MAGLDPSKMFRMSQGATICQGHFVELYVKHACQSLNKLGFEEEADALSRLSFGQSKGSLKLRELLITTSKPVLETIARRKNFKVDVDQHLQELSTVRRTTPRGPVHLARNFFIFDKVLGVSITMKRSNRGSLVFRDFIIPEPLETMVTLNALYETLSDLDDKFSDVDTFLKLFSASSMMTVRTPPTKLPVSVRRQILHEVGFSDPEIAAILTSPKSIRYSDSSTSLLCTSPEFIPTMRSRLKILRAESANLCIPDPHELWGVMTNWASVMQNLASILNKDLSVSSRLNPTYNRSIKIEFNNQENMPSMRPSLPSVKFLAKFFDCNTKPEVSKLMKDTFPTVCFPSVPLHRIHQTLDKLVQRGFTKDQIRSATPLLCYPPSLVEQKLAEMLSGPHRNEDPDRFLQICLYLIEKEFNFTSDGIFSSCGSPKLSPELLSEIKKYKRPSDDVSVNCDVTDECEVEEDARWGLYSSGNFGASNRSCLHASSRLFSSHSASDHFIPKRQFFSGFKGIVLQNPMRALRVWAELVNLKKEWDPSFDKQEFLLGTKHALMAVTSCIQKNEMSGLRGLLTTRERERIQTEIETEWKDIHRNNFDLTESDIVAAVPARVNRYYVAYHRFADIDIVFVVNRVRENSRPIMMIIRTTFTRDYTEGRLPEWTISKFKLDRFSPKPED